MNQFIQKIILDIVDINCNKCGRKSTQSNEHFLEMFIRFLKDYTKWKCLDDHKLSQYTNDNYRKKYIYWRKKNVFDDAFDVINAIVCSNLVNEKSLNCFIDATNIRNINGSYKRNVDENGDTLLGRMFSDKSKRGLKVSVIVTENRDLISVNVASGQVHDIKVVSEIYKDIAQTFKSNKKHRVNIVGDKGYVSNKYKEYFAEHKMNYITPDKKNKTSTNKYFWHDKGLYL